LKKIDRSLPIVAETEQILNRQNSPLNSRAEIFDGSGRQFFIVCKKICAEKSARYHQLDQSSGSDPVSSAAIEQVQRAFAA
jgi:hypothetical protein